MTGTRPSTNKKRVLYISHGTEDLYQMIRAAVPAGLELVTLSSNDEAERLRALETADAIIVAGAKLTRERIAAAKSLKFVHHQGVGYHDTVDCAALAERKVPLAITPGGTEQAVAEHTILLMLATMKRIPFMDAEMRQGRFHNYSLRHNTYELGGKTVGIVGLGRIGKGLARRLKPFGVRILYHDILTFPPELERELDVTRVPFDRLVAESDIVTIHVPRTPATQGMFNAGVFRRMKPTSFLINAARGGIVNEADLVEALRSGRIAGAGLDVFDVEPAPKNDPLYQFPNVVLTPHVAAGSRDAFTAKMRFVFKNLEAFFDGRPIEHGVDYVAEMRAAGAKIG
jgi:phosphoglycerate dehydrogenase-like enzyme